MDPSQLHFSVSGFNIRDTPLQLDRNSDILKGEANTISLKTLINGKKTSTGKVVTYVQPPLSIFSVEEYVPLASTAVLRTTQTDKFVTTMDMRARGEEGTPQDFIRYVRKYGYCQRLAIAPYSVFHPLLSAFLSLFLYSTSPYASSSPSLTILSLFVLPLLFFFLIPLLFFVPSYFFPSLLFPLFFLHFSSSCPVTPSHSPPLSPPDSPPFSLLLIPLLFLLLTLTLLLFLLLFLSRYIHKNDFPLSKVSTATATRTHPAQDRNGPECQGAKWDRPLEKPSKHVPNLPCI